MRDKEREDEEDRDYQCAAAVGDCEVMGVAVAMRETSRYEYRHLR